MDRVVEFLSENLSLVIGWIVVLAATAFINPYVTHRLHRAEARRGDHLVELKRELLQPMLDYLQSTLLPVLEHRLGNVGIRHSLIPQPTAGLTEMSALTETTLRHYVANEPLIDSYMAGNEGEQETLAFLDSALCGDARRRHFPGLFRVWDPLMTRVEEYSAACLRYAEELRSEIARSSLLPEFSGDVLKDRWINPTALAVVLFYRQLGLANLPFYHQTDRDPVVLMYTNHILAQGTHEEIARCRVALEGLLASRGRLEGLMGQARSIREDGLRAKAALEDHLLRRRLRGRCPYL